MKNYAVEIEEDEIIKKEMQFYGFVGFFKKRKSIKEQYKKLSTREKMIYKMYVYSSCFETEYCKDLMWEYLNNTDNYQDLRIFREYGARINRRRKRGRGE